MPTIVSFNKRIPPSSVGGGRGTLAELMAKRKTEADALSASMAPQETPTIMQGLGHVGQVISAGIREGRAGREEAASRDQLAQMVAGIGESGATQEQIAQMGVIDPEMARQYRQEAVQARADAAARQAAIEAREDEQRARAGESALERQARHEENAAQIAATHGEGEASRAVTTGEGALTRQQALELNAQQEQSRASEAAKNRIASSDEFHAKVEADKATAAAAAVTKQAEPQSAVGKAMSDYNSGLFGPVGSDEAIKKREAQIAKDTQLSAGRGGIHVGVDADGNPTVDIGGDLGTQGPKNLANALEDYRAAANQANATLPIVDAMSKAYTAAGPTGAGTSLYGAADDFLEAWNSPISLPGSSGARATIRSGGLDFVQKQVAAYKGAISDKETAMFVAAAPGMSTSREGARMLLGIAKATAQRAIAQDAAAQKWNNEHGNLEGFNQAWAAYTEGNPLIAQRKDGTVDLATNVLPADRAPDQGGILSSGAPDLGGGAPTPDQTAAPSEDDIQETMRANGMTRQQVLDALAKKAGGAGGRT